MTSRFGWRVHPVYGNRRLHTGIDFDCETGDSVYSVKDGTVVKSVYSNTGYGNHVTIQHGENEYSLYAHLTSLNMSNGMEVKRGQLVGACGTSGTSTGTHLHLEYRVINDGRKKYENFQDPRHILGL